MRYRVDYRYRNTDIQYVHIQPEHISPKTTQGETLLPAQVWRDAGMPEAIDILPAHGNPPVIPALKNDEVNRLVDALHIEFQHRNDKDVPIDMLKRAVQMGFNVGITARKNIPE